ncbi:MAG: alpha/beta fold hydrolase [Pseudomonadota bacterium]
MLGNMIADMMIKPGQAPLFDDPAAYDLDYENVEFETADGVTLRGWLIKGASDKVIVQSHFGVQCCRAGWTTEGKGLMKGYDRDIKFLRQAKYLNEAGYTVLMYDLRGHGESDVSPTRPWVTWGTDEARDVIAAVDFIAAHSKFKSANIGLLSICMGQGSTAEAYGMENGLKSYHQIKAMVAVQPLDYGHFIDKLGLPGFLRRSGDKAIEKRTGMDFNTSSWLPHAKDIAVPTLVIQNRNDAYLDEDFIATYYDSLTVEKEMLWLDLPKEKAAFANRAAAYDWIGENPEKILEWFGKHV